MEREFLYHGTSLADPNPEFSIEEVRSFYTTQFPELTTAAKPDPVRVRSGAAADADHTLTAKTALTAALARVWNHIVNRG